MVTTRLAVDDLLATIGQVPDPEVPVVSIADLGILRDVVADEAAGTVEVVITPTYSGCPAMEAIRDRIELVCRRAGWEPHVRHQLSPAWTTDWMSEQGRDRLREWGIAPPGRAQTHTGGPVSVDLVRRLVACPRCGSTHTTEIAHFGSTACKALRRCEDCREPFDEFKAI